MKTSEKKNSVDVSMLLPVLAVGVDLFTPYLIWQGILPAQFRWISHSAVAAMILICLFRMFGLNHIPRTFWLIVAIAILWSYVAIGHGQGIASTMWGIWLLFQFAFVGLFIYLQPTLPQRLDQYLLKFCFIVLVVQVAAQVLQYASGVMPGDDLSGLFGKNGTGNAVLFAILTCSIFLGYWITTGRGTVAFTALALGTISSTLGEMKLFLPAMAAVGFLAIVLYLLKHRAPEKMLLYLILILGMLLSYVSLYNILVPGAENNPVQSFITDPAELSSYLNQTQSFSADGNTFYNMGRDYAMRIGWESLQRDPITFLFGYGLGTRSESQSLGTAGLALTTGFQGLSVGTSLLVMMQEMGVVGLTLLAAVFLWLILALAHDIRSYPDSLVTGIRYALLLFSILWPLWLWYATTWTMRVPMLLYWLSMGYVFAETRLARAQAQNPSRTTALAGG